MIDSGYFVKLVVVRPDWLQTPRVLEICSVSNCISKPPDKWITRWLHNEFGWFNHIADALSVASEDRQSTYRLFAYRIHPDVFHRSGRVPLAVPPDVGPDPIPASFRSLGFDSVNKSSPSVLGFECSPLSCNSMASEHDVNEHCLFPTLERALAGAERFAIEQPEPGDYYVIEVLEGTGWPREWRRAT